MAQIHFPEPPPGAHVLWRLLSHLERGVLLWVVPEGVFAKRLCQGRVYWHGPLAPHRTQPNKLEREHTCQLLDTRRFLMGKRQWAGSMRLDTGVCTQWTEGDRQWVHKMWMQGIGLMDTRHGTDTEPDSGTQEWELHSQMLPKINKRSGA